MNYLLREVYVMV